MTLNPDIFKNQLNTIIQEYESLQKVSKYSDLSDLPKPRRQSIVTRGIAAVHRISGVSSTYSEEIGRLLDKFPDLHENTSSIMGVVYALRDDIVAGYLQTLVELVHGSVFGDFLEMAQHLLDSGYKDAAAVIAGSTIESHLRELSEKNGIDVNEATNAGDFRVKKSDRLNADLASKGAYSKLDQKNVTAWLDLRNKAAHGKYAEYQPDQVALLVAGIRDFVTRNPA